MVDLDNAHRLHATSLQAGILLDLERQLALEHGERGLLEDVLAFPVSASDIPDQVGVHFPHPVEDAGELTYDVRLEVAKDYRTGLYVKGGYFSNLYFLQRETVDEDLSFLTRIGYHLLTGNDGYLAWERNVIHTERGSHIDKELAKRFRELFRTKAVVSLEPLMSDISSGRDQDERFGLLDVYADEAEEIIGFQRRPIQTT